MIPLLKDKNGYPIPLDKSILYRYDGTTVEIIGYSYVLPNNEWIATSKNGEACCPSKLHLRNPLIRYAAYKQLRHMEKRFAELRERCK